MTKKQVCYRNVIFSLILLGVCQNGMSQVNANNLNSVTITTKVQNEVERIKDKLVCNYFDTLAFKTLDTNSAFEASF